VTVAGQGSGATDGDRMRSVELLGLPGAGKSSLVELVGPRPDTLTIPDLVRRERLRRRPLLRHRLAMNLMPMALKLRTLTGPVPDAKDAASFALDNPSHLDSVMRASQHIAEEANRELAVALLFESWAEHGFAARIARPAETVLFDEAALQRLEFFMALLPPGSSMTRELIDSVPLPDAVVLLDLPLELAIARVEERAQEFRMVEVMATMAERIAELVATLEHHDVATLVVDATRPASSSLAEIVDFLAGRSG
jgi:hypothetical protein